ncbi:PREDICTED: uncharacterized protein LOC109486781 [Branchiostoma belcheri]|uniref:Uncharacterized protein LOC109486781 n=1 Tax=Branchiostoma belcheri TaxID=7741 RepID=A0A6P4ZYJ6_BRABE|nr:PREDICTED: uncharacterized protein LOC109486781 [Branchiostoma belcheri]
MAQGGNKEANRDVFPSLSSLPVAEEAGHIIDYNYGKRFDTRIVETGEVNIIDESQDDSSDSSSLYKEQFLKGNTALKKNSLDEAEEHFAAALRTVHVKGLIQRQSNTRKRQRLCLS